ncbi:MAG: AAA domain-containing protein [Chloroflexota bacterium]|nr:AAA domain-containing protein [Dehalococcoidia bacterium]MDW8252422.1 AAA domain-containing protein [Chloroflexota bacterium]
MEPGIWVGERADETLLAAARALWAELPPGRRAATRIAAGFSALGWPIDLAIFTDTALAVVHLVPASGPLVARRAGLWHSGGAPILPDRPNPLLSLRLARLALLERLAERSPAVLGRAGDALVWDRAAGLVAIAPTLPAGSAIALGVPPRDCRVIGLDRLAGTVLRLRPLHEPVDPLALDRLLHEGLGLQPVGGRAEAAGCFLCTLVSRRCDLHRLRGIVVDLRQTNGVHLTIQTEDQWTLALYLNDPWTPLGAGIDRLLAAGAPPAIVAHHLAARVRDGRVAFAAGKDSLVVVAPEVLVDVTAVAEMAQCPLAYVVHQFEPKSPSEDSVRGKVVHAALRRLVRGETPADALVEAARESTRDLAFANVTLDAVLAGARDHVAKIAPVVAGQPGETETAVSNPQLGIAGRVDAVWERDGQVERVLELKTGRPAPALAARPNHRLQAQLYAASLWNAGRLDLAQATVQVAYTGGEELVAVDVRTDWPAIRQAVFVRNEAVLFDLTGQPLGELKRCSTCPRFLQDRCQFYADLLGYAPTLTTADSDRQTFRQWVAALRREAALEARSQLGASRRSLNARVEDGSCFRIDSIAEEEIISDGRWRARLRGRNISRFRVADRATLASDDPLGPRVDAAIEEVAADGIDVLADAPAPWATRLEPAASGTLLQGVFQGLTGWLRADDRLRRLVAGERLPRFGPRPARDPALDEYQQQAAAAALAAEDYALIWGPPGTGKTRTIARIVRAAGRRVLLAALTNQAVDNLALALLADGQQQLLIIGRPNRSHRSLLPFTLDAFGDQLDRIRDALAQTPVVLTTAHQVASGRYDQAFGGAPPFDLVILDEATQLTEPAALGVLRLGRAFVLVGDHKQLAPIVADPDSALARSLFDRLWAHPASAEARVMLARQYRMRAAIAEFPAQRWYEGRLETAPSAEAQPSILVPASRWPALWGEAPAVFAAAPADREADIVVTLVRDALRAGLSPDQIGVVSPYRQQVAELYHRLDDLKEPPLVDTVDRFQGSERDCIILAADASRPGDLLADERRLNVALTRARRKLIVVGDPDRLRRYPAAAALIDHFAQRGTLVSLSDRSG